MPRAADMQQARGQHSVRKGKEEEGREEAGGGAGAGAEAARGKICTIFVSLCSMGMFWQKVYITNT